MPRAEHAAMRRIFRDAFTAGEIVRFERDASGKVTALTVTTRGVHALRLTRRR